MVDMRHMDFLEKVAASDVMVINQKESTYQGSWKAAGGRSAWFMTRRNMDRLQEMMKPPKEPPVGFNVQNMRDLADNISRAGFDDKQMVVRHHVHPSNYVAMINFMCDSHSAEDIFGKIEEHPEGADGTVLAVVRDLRRYLMLVEAEMMARGVVAGPESGTSDVLASLGGKEHAGGVHRDVISPAMRERRVPRFEPPSSGSPMEQKTLDIHPNAPPSASMDRPGTPEDGGQHGALAPWYVGPDYFHRKNIETEVSDKFWQRRGSTAYVLEPYVENFQIPRVLRGLYNLRGESWILQIEKCPPDARSFFPNLAREKNMKEWDELPTWQRVLYTWNEQATKYELTERTVAWHAEAA